ncbi:SigB/SigF/SigG family RNA polymerase sigma factor [Jatrophihabitans sp.]|uniref:SigB/SigF/SigG family RNA polymerase sigma factor n=1 Tax=Jatrophihabitans sp. TaxID=1932789 RepID=UPI0030C734D9|nr:SigB/SigF/SigG family polymerase sigma factor [Jatrophihabitans sp.]
MTDSADEPNAVSLLAQLQSLPENSPERAELRERLVDQHMPLVVYLARRFYGRNEPMNDLIQVGAIGLIKAIDRFDPSRGLEFSTYATPTILGELKRHFRDTGWLIHVPRRAQELQTTLNAARADLSQELGRAPTVRELAKRIDCEEDAVIEALDVARAYSGVPLDILTPPGESAPEHPKLGFTDEGFEQVEQRADLREVIGQLPELEREILLLRFVANKTQTEIAGIVGVSQMQVSRLVARGLKRLRASMGVDEPE